MTARHASGLAASGGIECRLTNRRQSQRTGGNSVIRAVALLAVILIGLTGCGSSSKNQSGDTSGEPGAGTIVSDAPPANLDPSVHDASSWARGMTYRSRSGIDDDNTHVTGSVFVPKGDPPEGGYPVVALAPETIGTAADCAASLSPNLLGSSADVAALLKAGYVVFVPDYQGLGKPSDGKPVYHPYLDSTTAGYVIIDGVRAAKTLASAPTSTSWAVLGSFEGGQAAWATNELVDNYGSGLNLIATASLSPIADFEGLADAAMAGTLTPDQKLVYVAFLAALKNETRTSSNSTTTGAGRPSRIGMRCCHARALSEARWLSRYHRTIYGPPRRRRWPPSTAICRRRRAGRGVRRLDRQVQQRH